MDIARHKSQKAPDMSLKQGQIDFYGHFPQVLLSRKYIVFILLLLSATAASLFWLAQTRIQDFKQYHEQIAQDSVSSVANMIEEFVREKKRLVRLFASENIHLIREFAKKPDDEEVYEVLKNSIANHFPSHFAFTVADVNGVPVFEDFDGFVGELCKIDIQLFVKNQYYHPGVHPNYLGYHFDVMANYGGTEGILFISFHADTLAASIKAAQALGHQLMLIRPKSALIEVTSLGARIHLDRPDYRLSAQELSRKLSSKVIEGTVWHAVDLYEPELISSFVQQVIQQYSVIFLVFVALGVIMLRIVTQEERRRFEVEKKLMIAKDQADKANNTKSKFLASMSHELRTPLNAIIGYSELILEDTGQSTKGELEKDIVKIQKSGLHLLSLVNDILDLSKVESGKLSLEVSPFNVCDCVASVVGSLDEYVAGNNNTLTVACGSDVGEIISDRLRVKQVLYNLISNAAKFTHNGTIEVKVYSKPIEHTVCVVFEVIDTGIGISDIHINQLFQEFFQIDSSTNRKYAGTGLGLALSKRLCQLMGGDIEVHSHEGEGSTFLFWIPVK